jgi:hypothetical protein
VRREGRHCVDVRPPLPTHAQARYCQYCHSRTPALCSPTTLSIHAHRYPTGFASDEESDGGLDQGALREYELTKLKYYYAVRAGASDG